MQTQETRLLDPDISDYERKHQDIMYDGYDLHDEHGRPPHRQLIHHRYSKHKLLRKRDLQQQ